MPQSITDNKIDFIKEFLERQTDFGFPYKKVKFFLGADFF